VEVTRAISGIRIAIIELGNIKGEEIPMDYTSAGAGHKAHTILEPMRCGQHLLYLCAVVHFQLS
jgi:hypothetical protein